MNHLYLPGPRTDISPDVAHRHSGDEQGSPLCNRAAGRLAGLLALALLACQAAHAQSINIDFGVAYGLPDTYGAASGQTGTWNNISVTGTTTGLLDLSGAATGVDLTLTAASSSASSALSSGNNDELLLHDFMYSYSAGSGQWTIKLDNLASGQYQFFFYAPSDPRPSGDIIIYDDSFNSLDFVASVTGIEPGSLILGTSYSVSGLFDYDSSYGPLYMESDISHTLSRGLSGLQIVEVVEAQVPVSPTAGLLAIGLAGIGYGRRRKPFHAGRGPIGAAAGTDPA